MSRQVLLEEIILENLITFIHFIVLGLSLAAPVGPMNIEVMKRGLTEGLFRSWLVGLGGITGDILLLLAIYFGFAQFMELILIKILMYLVGIFMLGYLGVNSIISTFSTKAIYKEKGLKKQSAHPYLTGFIIALANPINLVFWFGVYGTSLQSLTATHTFTTSIVCSFAIILGLFLWNLNVIFTVHFSKQLMNEKAIKFITFSAGICLLGFTVHFINQLVNLLL